MEELNLRDLLVRESEQVEWKENVADIDDVVATISAFANDWANLGGGWVVCGAAEGRDEYGSPIVRTPGLNAARLREVEGTVMTRCRDRVVPPLVPTVREVPGHRVIVFVVPATGHAHTFRRKSDSGKYYIRQSRSTVEARNGLFRELLVRKRPLEAWDRRVHPEASIEDIDLLVLRSTLQRMGVWDPDRPVDDYLRPDHRIFALSDPLCVREPLTNVVRPRNYALLLFGRDVPRFVTGAHVIYSVYPGVDRSDPYSETRTIYGPLFEQIRMLEERLAIHTPMVFDKEDPATPNMVKYPLRALREAVVNALIHRNYEVSHPVRVTVFSDRVEIFSPGGMPVEVDREKFLAGSPVPVWRNQDLAMFCIKLRIAENQGQGIATIIRTMREAGCPPPEFDLGEHSVRCVLRANPRTIRAGVLMGFDASFQPPASLTLSSVFEIPAKGGNMDWERLRSVPVDVAAWQSAMDEIDRGVELVLGTTSGYLHVLTMGPYAAVAYLGRRLDDLARARTVNVDQLVADTGTWEPFSRPIPAAPVGLGEYFAPLWTSMSTPDCPNVLLAIDGMRPIADEQRDRLARQLRGSVYHLRPRGSEAMHPTQAASAVAALRRALATISVQHPKTTLHIITSAPSALIFELGRMLTPTAFHSAVIYHFVPMAATHVPVLDVVQRKVMVERRS